MTANGSTETRKRNALLADLENLWECYDALFEGMSAKDWTRKHGPDWTFADLPYHLAYFDRDLIAKPIARGEDVPAVERVQYRSLADLARYNGGIFARRPAAQTVTESIAQMRESRDEVRKLVVGLTDGDLMARCWVPLFGWVTFEQAIHGLIAHGWSHLIEAKIRLRRAGPVPSPSVTRHGLAFYVGILAGTFAAERAGDARLRVVFSFTGQAASEWNLRVAGGAVTVTPGGDEGTDLVLELSPDTFVRMLAQINHPMALMLTGKLRVCGFRKMGTFGKLFPPPQPDRALNLSLAPAVATA